MSDEFLIPNASEILIYQTDSGAARLEVRLQNETVWLTQKLMAELFQKNVRTINEHVANIYSDGELEPESTIRKFRMVQTEGKRQVRRLTIAGTATINAIRQQHARPGVGTDEFGASQGT